MLRIFSLFLLIVSTKAACDNACSGHGSCTTDDVCKCYDNWGVGLSHDSGDCSERVCPFEIAWVDTPTNTGLRHQYAECAGRGICNRDTAECQCFDGYEGKACQRTTCPNDCSGHGTCEYIEDLHFAATWNDYTAKDFSDEAKTFDYHQWDNKKIRGCVCDALYGDVDCSKQMCSYATDVLDTRPNLDRTGKYQTQQLRFQYLSNELRDYLDDLKGTFAITFKSRLNETFTTIPLVYKPTNLPDFTHDIQMALLQLPNQVIDGVKVAAYVSTTSPGVYTDKNVLVNVTFTGDSVQGPQHLLAISDYECAAGCTPKITGLALESRQDEATASSRDYSKVHSNITESLSDFNSFECGRRGKCDYSSGLCQCFTGYSGAACNTLSSLV